LGYINIIWDDPRAALDQINETFRHGARIESATTSSSKWQLHAVATGAMSLSHKE
jgi:hypothetical protein